MIFPLLLMKALLRSNNNRKKMGLTLALSEHFATKNGCDQLAAVSKPKKKELRTRFITFCAFSVV